MRLISPASASTETNILYADGHKDGHTDRYTGWFQYTSENIRFVGYKNIRLKAIDKNDDWWLLINKLFLIFDMSNTEEINP